MPEVYILSAVRTPIGSFGGALKDLSATQLGAIAIKAAVERAGVSLDAIDQVIMGCVLPGALGQAPARQASIGAGLPLSTGATTINKVCGSGMKATMMAAEAIIAGTSDIVVAGGMESMTNAPYMLTKHRSGARLGHDSLKDSMFLDGLEDAYEPGRAMGSFAEETCTEYQFTREQQDDYALRSLSRAKDAIASGAFTREIVAVEVAGRSGVTVVEVDEQPGQREGEGGAEFHQPRIHGVQSALVAIARIELVQVAHVREHGADDRPQRGESQGDEHRWDEEQPWMRRGITEPSVSEVCLLPVRICTHQSPDCRFNCRL
jgi:acetyl-CoA C-acetyltransferase